MVELSSALLSTQPQLSNFTTHPQCLYQQFISVTLSGRTPKADISSVDRSIVSLLMVFFEGIWMMVVNGEPGSAATAVMVGANKILVAKEVFGVDLLSEL